MTEETLRKTIVECLGRVVPQVSRGRVDPAVTFHDQFGIDSLDFLNFALELEKELGIEIPEEDYPKLSTLASCESFVRSVTAVD